MSSDSKTVQKKCSKVDSRFGVVSYSPWISSWLTAANVSFISLFPFEFGGLASFNSADEFVSSVFKSLDLPVSSSDCALFFSSMARFRAFCRTCLSALLSWMHSFLWCESSSFASKSRSSYRSNKTNKHINKNYFSTRKSSVCLALYDLNEQDRVFSV